MRITRLKAMVLLIIFAVCLELLNAAPDVELWQQFMENHGKSYKGSSEEKIRFDIFQSNLRNIKEHNIKYKNGKESYHLGVTQFADMTEEEFRNTLILYEPEDYNVNAGIFEFPTDIPVPDTIDWRTKNAVLEVKNQKECGSCWAFSATGALEGQQNIKYNTSIPLSEQNLVDCSSSFGNRGCKGGLMEKAFDYVKRNGIESEKNYPYFAKDQICVFNESKSQLKAVGFNKIRSKDESALKAAVGTVGPISVAINANYFNLYSGGIFDNPLCSDKIMNHGVLVIGYGSENDKDYWLVKNSWGTNWGEKGYIKMIRNRENQCGIANDASYPVLA